MSYIQEAFNLAISNAEQPQAWYVCLMESIPFYGGPEEGGWWGCDSILIAYKEYVSEELAQKAKEAVDKLAKDLQDEARAEYGERCLRELDWLEQRGLDADWLPEPDGESEYHVIVTQSIPENYYGCRHYE